MAKPDWAGPLAPIPENWKEFERMAWTTGILTGVYTAIWALNVWNTIPRMAAHHYWNPSRRAIINLAIRQTPMPSLLRLITGFSFWTPLTIIAVGLTIGELVGEKVSHQSDYDRIDRARAMSMGVHTPMSAWYSHSLPYFENPDGERIWYSFHPENI